MDVGEWLRGLGPGEYGNKFRDNRIDAEVLSQLTADDPKGIGVSLVGERRKLIAAIAALAGTTPPTESQASPNKLAPRIGPHVSAERRPITVMLCDLGDDCPQRHFLDEKGENVFDIGFEIPDASVAEAEGVGAGLKITTRGRCANGSGFTHFDTADQAGGVTLFVRAEPAGSKT
jgi:hypothetical protein